MANPWGIRGERSPRMGNETRQAEAAPASAMRSPLSAAPHTAGHRKGERFSPPAFSVYLPLSEALWVRERGVEALCYPVRMGP